jgi:copper chaperone CopZ
MFKMKMSNSLGLILAVLFLISCGRDKKSIRTEGAPLEASTIEVSIGGMTCTGCEQTIQAGVIKLDGIKSIKASHLSANAIIEYYPDVVDTLKIKEAISGTGYTVKKFIIAPQN